MLRWLAPRVPPRQSHGNLRTFILDDGLSKVSFNRSQDTTLLSKAHPGNPIIVGEQWNAPHPLLVYNSLPPAPSVNPFEPNSSLCPPFHIHLHEDETFKVLSGDAKFFLVESNDPPRREDNLVDGCTMCTVSRGSYITIPRGKIHTFRNASTTNRLELQFGFSSAVLLDDIVTHKAKAEQSFGKPESADHTDPTRRFRENIYVSGTISADHQHSLSDSDPRWELQPMWSSSADTRAPRRSDTGSISRPISVNPSIDFSSRESNKPLIDNVKMNGQSYFGNDPLRSGAASPRSISTKMYRFFLNTQLYRSDCTRHSLPRTLPQLLLFNHAAGVVLVPPWLLSLYVRFRFLRPLVPLVGRFMNVIIGVIWGQWICGLKSSYPEYVEQAGIDVLVEQAAREVQDLTMQVSDLEKQINQERESQDSGLVCSAWKSHEFDGQDEGWRKNV